MPDDFGEVVRRYRADVYVSALQMTGDPEEAEDLVQEAFLRAYRHRADFDGDSEVSTWLYRITVNIYLNEQRRNRPQAQGKVDVPPTGSRITGADPPGETAQRRHLHDQIRAAFQVLTPRERTAVTLRHVSRKSTELTAEIMGVAEGTVKSLLYRGLRKLREQLAPIRDQLE